MNKIDAHQHLLYPDQFDYSWSKDLPSLQGAFHLEDYQAGAADCNIEGTLFMEVDVDAGQRMRAANLCSQLAADPASKILGIIARVRPEEADFEEQLDLILYPSLKGIRRVVPEVIMKIYNDAVAGNWDSASKHSSNCSICLA